MNIIKTGWLSSIPYLFAIISMVIVSYLSDKKLNRKIFIWPFLFIAALAFSASWWLGPDHFGISFLLLIIAGAAMYAPYGPFFATIPEILPGNVVPGAIALINSAGALGSFAGAFLVGYLNGTTGGFNASYLLMAVFLFIASALAMMAIPDKKNES